MAVKIRRTYKGAAVSAVLNSGGVSSATQTSITLTTSPSTWPTGKFFVVVAPGTASEEKMCVTLSGSTLTVVDPAVSSTSASANGRGVDNTTARSAIAGGSSVYPVFTAVDADEANELTSTYSAQGHIVYQGASTFAGLAIGTASHVLKVNSGATAPEWGQVATAGLADNAVTLAKLAAAVQAALAPAGSLMPYGGSSAPTGWLLCYGQAVSRSTYADLFTALGTTYGSGDGSTTFNVPDLRGRVIAGQDDMGGTSANRLTGLTGGVDGDVLGGVGGAETHTLTTGELAAHTHSFSATTGAMSANSTLSHSITDPGHTHSLDDSSQLFTLTDGTTDGAQQLTIPPTDSTGSSTTGISIANHDVSHTHTVSGTSGSAGSGSAHNNVQPTIILNYIIKT